MTSHCGRQRPIRLQKLAQRLQKKLLEFIDDPDRSIALAAVSALGLMGSTGNDSVPALIAAGERISAQNDPGNTNKIRQLYHGIGSALSKVELGDAVTLVRRLLTAENPENSSFCGVYHR